MITLLNAVASGLGWLILVCLLVVVALFLCALALRLLAGPATPTTPLSFNHDDDGRD